MDTLKLEKVVAYGSLYVRPMDGLEEEKPVKQLWPKAELSERLNPPSSCASYPLAMVWPDVLQSLCPRGP